MEEQKGVIRDAREILVQYLAEIAHKTVNESDFVKIHAHIEQMKQKIDEVGSLLQHTNPEAYYRRVYDITSYLLAKCRVVNSLQISDMVERSSRNRVIKQFAQLLESNRAHLRDYYLSKTDPVLDQSLASVGLYFQQQFMERSLTHQKHLWSVLADVKNLSKQRNAGYRPSLYVFYAAPTDMCVEQERHIPAFLTTLRAHLIKGGVDAFLNLVDCHQGEDIVQFVNKHIQNDDYVLMVCSESLLLRHTKKTLRTDLFAEELNLILNKDKSDSARFDEGKVLLIELSGTSGKNYPIGFKTYNKVNNWRNEAYLSNLRQLLALLHALDYHSDAEYRQKWLPLEQLEHGAHFVPMPDDQVTLALSEEQNLFTRNYQHFLEVYGQLVACHCGEQQVNNALQARSATLLNEYLDTVIRNNERIYITGGEGGLSLELKDIYVALTLDKTTIGDRQRINEQCDEYIAKLWHSESLIQDSKLQTKLQILHNNRMMCTSKNGVISLDYLYRELLMDPQLSETEVEQADIDICTALESINEKIKASLSQLRTTRGLSLQQVYSQHRHLIILGQPGSGKTTIARWLTMKMAKALRTNPNETPMVYRREVDPSCAHDNDEQLPLASRPFIPILVAIYEYSIQRNEKKSFACSLIDFINLRYDSAIVSAVKQGRAMIILDGIDEIVNPLHRDDIIKEIDRFYDQYCTSNLTVNRSSDPFFGSQINMVSQNSLVLTSRIAGNYTKGFSAKKFTRVIIEEMGNAAVVQFFQRWMLAAHLDGAALENQDEVSSRALENARSLIEQVRLQPHLQSMVRVPQVASVMAYVYYFSDQLPKSRAEQYEKAIHLLTQHFRTRLSHNQPSIYELFHEEGFYRVLEYIAYESHMQTGPLDERILTKLIRKALPKETRNQIGIIRLTGAINEILSVIRKDVGLLTAVGERSFRFIHRTFEEFLAGRHIVKSAFENDESSIIKEFQTKISDINWREPLLMALGYLENLDHELLTEVITNILGSNEETNVVLPKATLLVVDALTEFRLSEWEYSERKRLVDQLVDNLLGTYKRQYAAKFQPMLIHLQHAFIKIMAVELKKELIASFITLMSKEYDAAVVARVLVDMKWRERSFVQPLQSALEFDDQEFCWSIRLAIQFHRSLKSINVPEYARGLQDSEPVTAMTAGQPWKNSLSENTGWFEKIISDGQLLPILATTMYGFNYHATPAMIKMLFESLSYSLLPFYYKDLYNVLLHDEWGVDFSTNFLSFVQMHPVSWNFEKRDFLLRTIDWSQLNDEQPICQLMINAVKCGDSTQDIIERIRANLPEKPSNMVTMALLESKDQELFTSTQAFSKKQIAHVLRTRLAAWQGLVCSINYTSILQFLKYAEDCDLLPPVIATSAILQVLMHQGGMPFISIDDIQRCASAQRDYLVGESISCVTTGQSLHLEQKKLYLVSLIYNNILSANAIIKMAAYLPLYQQQDQPHALNYWSFEQFPIGQHDNISIPSSVFTMCANAPRMSALKGSTPFFCFGLVGELGSNYAKSLRKAEAIIVIITSPKDSYDPISSIQSIDPSFELSYSWQDDILTIIDKTPSIYHQIRAYSRMLIHLPSALRVKVVEQAYSSIKMIEHPFEKAHVCVLLLRAISSSIQSSIDCKLIMLETVFDFSCQATSQCEDFPEQQAMLYAQLVFYAPQNHRWKFVASAIQSTKQIENEESRAHYFRLLLPLVTVYQEQLDDEITSVRESFKNPYYKSYALGRVSVVIRAIFDKIMSNNAQLGLEFTPLLLSATVHDLQDHYQCKNNAANTWLSLKELSTEEFEEKLYTIVSKNNIILSVIVVLVLDDLFNSGHFVRIEPFVEYFEKPHYETLPVLRKWFLETDSELIKSWAALLIIELTEKLQVELIPYLIGLLSSPHDLLRYRAAHCLHHENVIHAKPRQLYSVLGAEPYRALVQQMLKYRAQRDVEQRIYWVTHDMVLDTPRDLAEWMREYCQCDENTENHKLYGKLLDYFTYVTPSVWQTLAQLMLTATTRGKSQIFKIVSGMLYRTRNLDYIPAHILISDEDWYQFVSCCLEADLLALSDNCWCVFSIPASFLVQKILCSLDTDAAEQTDSAQDLAFIKQEFITHGTVSYVDVISNEKEVAQQTLANSFLYHYCEETISPDELSRSLPTSISNQTSVMKRLLAVLHHLKISNFVELNRDGKLFSHLVFTVAVLANRVPVIFQTELIKSGFQSDLIVLLQELVTQGRGYSLRCAALTLLIQTGLITQGILSVLDSALQGVEKLRELAIKGANKLCLINTHQAYDMINHLVAGLADASVVKAYTRAQILTNIAGHEKTDAQLRQLIFKALHEAERSQGAQRLIYLDSISARVPNLPSLKQFYSKCLMSIAQFPAYDFQYHRNRSELVAIPAFLDDTLSKTRQMLKRAKTLDPVTDEVNFDPQTVFDSTKSKQFIGSLETAAIDIYLSGGDLALARECFHELIRINEGDANNAYTYLSICYFVDDQIEKAERLLLGVLNREPMISIRTIYAMVLIHQERYYDAIQQLTPVLVLKKVFSTIKLGQQFYPYFGEHLQKLLVKDSVLEISVVVLAYYLVCECYAKTRQIDQMQDEITIMKGLTAVKNHVIHQELVKYVDQWNLVIFKEANRLRHVANAYDEKGVFDLAITEHNKVLAIGEFAIVRLNVGSSYHLNGMHTRAEQAYIKALHLKPQHSGYHCMYALLLYDTGRYEKAISHCQQTLAYFTTGESFTYTHHDSKVMPALFFIGVDQDASFQITHNFVAYYILCSCYALTGQSNALSQCVEQLIQLMEVDQSPYITRIVQYAFQILEDPSQAMKSSVVVTSNSDEQKDVDEAKILRATLPEIVNRDLIRKSKDIKKQKAMLPMATTSPPTTLIRKEPARYGLFKTEHIGMNAAQQLLTASVPQTMIVWQAFGKGDCFFDSLALALRAASLSNKHDMKSLRVICARYARELDQQCLGNPNHPDNWIGLSLKQHYQQYLANIEFTVKEREQGLGLGNDRLAVWGEQHVDGRILATELNVVIHLIEIQPNPDFSEKGGERFFIAHNMVTGRGVRTVDPSRIDYEDDRVLHLVGYRNHFVPLLPKASVELATKDSCIISEIPSKEDESLQTSQMMWQAMDLNRAQPNSPFIGNSNLLDMTRK